VASVCLNMIVKNETGVIKRCLDSVRPFIQSWVIVDTGSTDGTQDLIRRELADIPGELHERPWRDFGTNRSEALELARGKADYLLIIDADEELEVPPAFVMPELVADQYMLVHRRKQSPALAWDLANLVKSALPWRYRGVVHEVIVCDEPHTTEFLRGPTVWGHFDSARNAPGEAAKYAADARVLEAALLDEPDNARYVFYLAQSYRDAGNLPKAVEAYERRATMGGWDEEVFYALYQIAVLGDRLGVERPLLIYAYLRAYEFRRTRAEPLRGLAGHFRSTSDWAQAELFARAAVAISRPSDMLFVEDSVYEWHALDELAIACYWLDKHEEARQINRRLLSEGLLPESERERVEKNLAFSEGK
jgi:glycosyltransferase involved in cell wall biosynthesis